MTFGSGLGSIPFEPTTDQIWQKAYYIDYEHEVRGFRRDRFGYLIQKSQYGNRNSTYGWEKDHTFPASLGGLSTLSNLEPVNWKANVQKSNHTGLSGLSYF